MVAAHTALPVIGVPVESHSLKGLDSLLSIVQMPGGVPVATVAIGKAGAINAALLAVSILATGDPALRERAREVPRGPDRASEAGHARMTRRAHPSGRDHRGPRQRPARTDVRDGRAGGSAIAFTSSRRTPTRPRARLPTQEVVASYEDLDAIRAFARRRGRGDLRVRERAGGDRRCRRSARARSSRRIRSARRTAARAREGLPRRPRVPGDAVRVDSRARGRPDAAARRDRRARPCSRRRASATTARGSRRSLQMTIDATPGTPWAARRPCSSGSSRFDREDVDHRRARAGRTGEHLRPHREHARATTSSTSRSCPRRSRPRSKRAGRRIARGVAESLDLIGVALRRVLPDS